ncbi:helix-turn-helix domain-containing protein [Paracraurococcus ruber]|nr:helix-turn-helix domain-containing protein [Paracraurococcus ruber]TDG33969.1 helix-turn-helix domain-containing protein [Paracraurococcus ruber]
MAGARHADIAKVLGISVPTLRKRFASDLAAGKAEDLFTAEAAPPTPRQRSVAGGRKPLRPDFGQRRRVMDLAACGKPPKVIARVLGVSEPTLRKHYAEELATGAERVEAEVISALMSKARSGNVSALKEARAIISQARLDEMQEALTAGHAPAKPPKAETPGKKLQAAREAADVIATADWAAHLRPN